MGMCTGNGTNAFEQACYSIVTVPEGSSILGVSDSDSEPLAWMLV